MKPTVALVGAEFEENLSIRYLASSIEREGFEAVIIPFNDSAAAREIAAAFLFWTPWSLAYRFHFKCVRGSCWASRIS